MFGDREQIISLSLKSSQVSGMFFTHVKVSNFRNFESLDIPFSNGINFFCGNNGVGKTSILEFLYYLSLAKSFRSSNNQSLIKSGCDSFNIYAVLQDYEGNKHFEGIERKYDGSIRVVYDNKNVVRNSDMAKNLCVQLISPASFSLLTDGSSVRISFIDWGVFYNQESYGKIFNDFTRVLKQRNSLIHTRSDDFNFEYWDLLFVKLSNSISEYRDKYINEFTREISLITKRFIPDYDFKFSLSPGYKRDESLLNILKRNRNREFYLGYTLCGPHKCDLKIKANDTMASQILSRGEQKLLVMSMLIAQGLLYAKKSGSNCIFLIDDIASELDENNQNILCELIKSIGTGAQFFITILGNGGASRYIKEFPDALFYSVHDNNVLKLSN